MKRLLAIALAAALASPAAAVDLRDARVTHLDNGLTLLVLEEPSLPVVSVQMAYRTGGRDDPEGRMGLAHFFEHMAFRSSKHFPGTRLAGDIYAVGGEWHGYTWIDTITFFATAPKDELDLLLRIEADRLGRLKLDPADVEAETGAVIAEMNGYANDPATVLFDATLAAAFDVHPYRKNTIGYAGNVRAITHNDIVQFYRDRIGPKTAVLAIVGDVDAAAVENRVEKLFVGFMGRAEPMLPPPSEPDIDGVRRVRLEGAATEKLFRVAYPAPAASAADYPAFLVMQALAGASSGVSFLQNDWGTPAAPGSLLAGVSDDAATWFIPTAQPYVFLIAGSAGADANEIAIETAIQRALDSLAEKPISEARLGAAKEQVLREVVLDVATTEDAAHQLAYFEAIGALDQLFNLEDRVAAVTAEDVQRVAAAWLRADRRTIGWFVPDTDGAGAPIDWSGGLQSVSAQEGRPATPRDASDARFLQTDGALLVVEHAMSPAFALNVVLDGRRECDACTPGAPAPGLTTLSKTGLISEFDAALQEIKAEVAAAAPETPTGETSSDPYARLEEVFAARFAAAPTSLSPRPLFAAAVGAFDAADFRPAIEGALGAPSGEAPRSRLTPSQGDLSIRINEPKAQTALGYMAPAPALEDEMALAWRMALYLFAHDYGGRLGDEAISRRGLAYYADARYRGDKGAGLVTLNIGVDPDKQEALVGVLRAELARFVEEPPDAADLAEARRHLIGRKISAAQSHEEIAAALAQDWAGPGLSTIDDYAAAVNAVTLDELRGVLPAFVSGDVVIISVGAPGDADLQGE